MDSFRKLKGKVASRLFRYLKLFEVGEFFGFHIVPDHFYYPIPSTRDLEDTIFERKSECVGLDWNLPVQINYLDTIFPKYAQEVEFKQNPGLSLVDAAVLHAMVRHHKPKKMIEIGSGSSTRIAAEACLLNKKEDQPCRLIAVEPFPDRQLDEGFPGLTELKKQKVESVGTKEFVDCDLLFIDSSHMAMIGSDVLYEQLEILPRLKPGCLIHFHDILLPGEYWKDWVKDHHLFWTEQYLLWAFLLFNNSFEVIWASRFMHLRDSTAIQEVFPYFKPDEHRITSFWIKRK
jgi:predicted O-methyltransferase YrrM